MGISRITIWRSSKTLILIVVAIAMFLDAVLRSVIVPIIPDLLLTLRESNSQLLLITERSPSNYSSATSSYNENSINLSTKIGFLLASKSFFEMIWCPVCGPLTVRYGYSIIMFAGFGITILSTVVFAFSNSYELMFIARAFQGVGTAMTTAPGLGLLADTYQNDEERGEAMSTAFTAVSLGSLIGPLYGGVMYHLVGKIATLLSLAMLCLIDGCLRLSIIESNTRNHDREKYVSIKTLIKDTYILIVLGTIFISNFSSGVLEALLPSQMKEIMNTSTIEQGSVFLPLNCVFLIVTKVFGSRLSSINGRCWLAIAGMVMIGVFMLSTVLMDNFIELLIPSAGLGAGYALVKCTMYPHLAYLVDTRHASAYGNIYGLAQFTYCLAYVVSSSVSGILTSSIGYHWTMTGTFLLCILCAPPLYFLQDTATSEESQSLKQDG